MLLKGVVLFLYCFYYQGHGSIGRNGYLSTTTQKMMFPSTLVFLCQMLTMSGLITSLATLPSKTWYVFAYSLMQFISVLLHYYHMYTACSAHCYVVGHVVFAILLFSTQSRRVCIPMHNHYGSSSWQPV